MYPLDHEDEKRKAVTGGVVRSKNGECLKAVTRHAREKKCLSVMVCSMNIIFLLFFIRKYAINSLFHSKNMMMLL